MIAISFGVAWPSRLRTSSSASEIGGQRIAQFVAEHGEELVLRVIGVAQFGEQPVALRVRRLQLLARGDVLGHFDRADDHADAVGLRLRVEMQPIDARALGRRAVAMFADRRRHAVRARIVERARDGRRVRARHHGRERPADDVGASAHRRKPVVREHDAVFGAGEQRDRQRRVHQHAVALALGVLAAADLGAECARALLRQRERQM